MKIAIISDIHSNLEALKEVMREIESLDIDKIHCLGDVVGYGANPNECMDIVRQHASTILAGNHDFAAVDMTDLTYFNRYAREAALWTAHVLTEENRQYLRALEYVYREGDALLVHATPEEPELWDYITSAADAERNFDAFDEHVCFIGHSHVPVVFYVDAEENQIEIERAQFVELNEHRRYIINVGSVGQPRDLDARAAFGVFDTDRRTFELKRLDYPFEIAQSKIRAAGLPEFLADRLAAGQ